MLACSLRFWSPPTLEISSVNSFGESRLDGIVETCLVVICQLTRVGTFVEAVDQGPVRLGRHNRHVVKKMNPVGLVERGMMGLETSRMVSLVVQPSLMIMTCRRQFLGSRHPHKMVFPSRVTLQPVLWKNTLHPALHRMATDRRLLTRPGSQCTRHALGGRLLRSRSTA